MVFFQEIRNYPEMLDQLDKLDSWAFLVKLEKLGFTIDKDLVKFKLCL